MKNRVTTLLLKAPRADLSTRISPDGRVPPEGLAAYAFRTEAMFRGQNVLNRDRFECAAETERSCSSLAEMPADLATLTSYRDRFFGLSFSRTRRDFHIAALVSNID
jgi:hypothetical protein